jgi:hypothetical protein
MLRIVLGIACSVAFVHSFAAIAISQPSEEKFGEASFSISCSPAAQRQFNTAVAMLHSFHYPRTVREFTAIASQEPSCAMAYWGIAISQRSNPLVGPFSQDLLRQGWDAIQRARKASQKNDRESAWIEAMAAFYEGYEKVDQRTRTARYETAMERLHAAYPDDVEAAVFYALALNEAADLSDLTYARQLKAAAILEALQPGNPKHPGIPHYIVHSYDYPQLAERGLSAAALCAQIAPSTPHALHMPSHIFSMRGMWRDVIDADNAADALIVSRATAADRNVNLAGLGGRYHSLDFLMNAHLQLGQLKEAKRIVDLRNSLAQLPAELRYTSHTAFAAIPVRYAFERGAWAEAAKLAVPRTPYPQAEAITWFGRALGAARSKDLEGAKKALVALQGLKKRLETSDEPYWAGQVHIQELATLAWISLQQGQKAAAIVTMRGAADLEDKSEKHIAMENRLSPMRELLAELLVEVGEPAQARIEFERSLRLTPNRYRSIAGAARTGEHAGDRLAARKYYEELVALSTSADVERPEVAVARRFLAKE